MDLIVKVSWKSDKLEGQFQGGVVVIWMVLKTIVKMTPAVTSVLQNKIKLFAPKGLCLCIGKNVETAVIENMAICMHSFV